MAPLRAICCAALALGLAACDREPPKPKVALDATLEASDARGRASPQALARAVDPEVPSL